MSTPRPEDENCGSNGQNTERVALRWSHPAEVGPWLEGSSDPVAQTLPFSHPAVFLQKLKTTLQMSINKATTSNITLKNKLFICLFLAVLGLRCCMGLSLVAVSGGYSLAVKLLSVVTSYCAAQAVGHAGFNSCDTWAQYCNSRLLSIGSIVGEHKLKLLRGTWNLPGSGVEPVTPAFAGRSFTTEPPGKPL